MLERGNKFLPREDSDAAHILQEQLKKDGVKLHLHANPNSFELQEGGEIKVNYTGENGAKESLIVDTILIACGRKPNVDGIGLDVAGV